GRRRHRGARPGDPGAPAGPGDRLPGGDPVSGRHRGVRRHTGAGMAWRQFAADPWVSVGLALLVAVVSVLLTAVPRALQDVNDRQLAQDVGGLSALQRDVTGRWSTTVEVPAPSGVDPWVPFEEGAATVRAAQP